MTECRFCTRKLSDENHSTITEEIKEYFTKITQIELLQNGICSNLICELCLRSLQLAHALRQQLLENEQRLYEILDKTNEEYEEMNSPIQSFDPDFHRINYESDRSVNFESNFDPRVGYAAQSYTNQQLSESDHHPIITQILSKNISTNSSDSNQELLKIPITKLKSEYKEDDEIIEIKTESDENTIIHEEPKDIITNYFTQAETIPQKSNDNFSSKAGNISTNKKFSSTQKSSELLPSLEQKRSFRSSEKVLHRNPETNKFECHYCTFITDSQNVIKTHLITSHKAEITTYKCKYCDSTYFKGSNLKRHILVKHMNHRFECLVPSCNVQLQDRSSLRRHIVSTHGKNMTQDQIQELMKKTRKEPQWYY